MSTPSEPQDMAAGHPQQIYPPAQDQPFNHAPMPPAYPPRQPPGYAAPPGYAPQYYVARPNNGLAIAAMVLGILWIYWIGSILALIFGYAARKQIRERNEGGDGMAIAGIVLGWIGVGTLGIVLIIAIAAASTNGLR